MSYVKDSFLFHLILSLWNSFLNLFQASAIGRTYQHLESWFVRKWNESFFVHLFYDEGKLSQLWPDSAFCKLIDAVLNLPLRLVQWIYGKLRRPLDNSFFATLAFEAGKESFLAASWFMALILCIPYDYWNNAYSLLLFAFVLVLLFVGGMNEKGYRLTVSHLGPYITCFFAAVAVSVPLSNHTGLSFRYLPYHIACILVVVALVNAVEKSSQLLRLGGGLGMGILVASAYGIYQQVVIGVEVNKSYVDLTVNPDMPGRVYSYFDNPNALGEVLLMVLPIMVSLIFVSRRLITKAAALGVFCVGAICLGMTYSRASWIGLVAAAVCYVFLWNRKLLPLCFVAGIAAIPLLPTSIFNRILTITNMNDSSTSSRFPQYEAAIRLLMNEPITGAGLGADAVRRTVQLDSLYQGRAPFVHAHNTFLQIWLETGLLGLVSFISSLLWTAKTTARSVKNCPDIAAKHMAIGGISSMFGIMVCGLADYVWTYPRIMFVFWFIVGLTLAAIKVCKMNQNSI